MGAGERRADRTPPGLLTPLRYRPQGQYDLAPATPAQRLKANLAALRTLRLLQREQRPPTLAEQRDLAGWSGWGAISEVFDETRAEHHGARAELRRQLTEQEYAAAARSTINAHYTDAAIVQSIWAAVARLGFTGGQVLEPGCGSGNFIAFAPPGARVTGVESEPVTAAIAAALYPDAPILTGSFAGTRLPEDSFDLVVGNVPFGKVTLTDRRHNRSGHSIHNHFIIKSLALTRPGGIMAVLTSRYTMDSGNPVARREIAGLADLLGAVRLPTGAHQQAAGTRVVTDLLILRRREPGGPPAEVAWERVWPVSLDGHEVLVNEYFLDNSQFVLGTLTAVNGAYRAGDLAVRPAGELIPALDGALSGIADRACAAGLPWSPPRLGWPAALPGPTMSVHPEGFLQAHPDGTFSQVAGGRADPCPVPRSQAAELRALLGLRDATRSLLDAEAATAEDMPEIERLRGELGRRYDAYAATYGPLNRFSWRRTGRVGREGRQGTARVRPPQGGFRTDPFAPLVYALEDWDPVTQRAAKTAIFTRRVVAPRAAREAADSPADALAICVDACGEARLDEIAQLLDTTEDVAREQLGTLVFDEPGAGRLVPAAEYLSGRVREKLRAAEQAAADDPRFAVNVAELRAVIPRDLGPGEIDARLGAAWIGAKHVQQFLREILDDESLRVEHPGGQVWTVRGNRHTVLAISTWGTDRYPAPALAQAVLEQRVIEVRDKLDNDSWVLNLDATLAAQGKAAELGERFAGWVWEDPGRAEELARAYNEAFNGIVLRSYDDVALSLPGLAEGFQPRPHQIAAVARIVHEPAVLLAHEVGAGKTAEMVMGAMELRRLGLARKPCVVVPNHMLNQFAREWLQLYPQARVLVTQREDLQRENRRRFVARCATGDWDGIIMSRSAFERIPMSATAQRAYLDRELAQFREWIAEARKGEGLSVKRLEAALLRAEERLRSKLDSVKDPGVTFEETGIDWLGVDEAHGYKALRTPSAIRDAAIDGSMRASDLDMKIDYLRRRNGKRVITFATATPIANSVTEAYVMQRYLRPDLLEAAGVAVFDTWAATFGQVVTQVELAPEGGDSFRLKSRFAKFQNVPEMLRLFHVAADVKTGEDLNLPAPALVPRPGDGQRAPQAVITEPTPELLAYVAELGERAEAVRSRAVRPEEDNMLKVSSDGRKAALDLRLVGLPQTGPSKVDGAAELIAGIWRDHRDDEYPRPDGLPSPVRGSLQIVFCDLGTPGERWNVYDYLRDELAERGVPREQIRFIHEARTDRDKAELFAACRAGRVAVLIGSTEKLGVGTNVQARAVTLHHLDAPWRPADVAQREGRILRQGNHNSEVVVYRHVTRASFDGYVWQALERKGRFVAQIMRGRLDVREIEDIGDAALSYTEVKALATGNPLLMDKAKADAELTRLERAERAHHRTQDALRHTVTRLQARIAALETLTGEIDAAITRRVSTRGEAFTMTVDGATHTKRADAGAHLKRALIDGAAAARPNGRQTIRSGRLGGFDVTAVIDRLLGTVEVSLGFDGAPGQDLRMTLAELSEADPAGLVVRLENRLARLEDHKEGTLAEITRLRAELGHATNGIGAPFPQASQLAAARERSRHIDEQLQAAATTPPTGEGHGPEDSSADHAAAEADQDPPVRRDQSGTLDHAADQEDRNADQPDPDTDHRDQVADHWDQVAACQPAPDQQTDSAQDWPTPPDQAAEAWRADQAERADPGHQQAQHQQEGSGMAQATTSGQQPAQDPQPRRPGQSLVARRRGNQEHPGREERTSPEQKPVADQPGDHSDAAAQVSAPGTYRAEDQPVRRDHLAVRGGPVRDAVHTNQGQGPDTGILADVGADHARTGLTAGQDQPEPDPAGQDRAEPQVQSRPSGPEVPEAHKTLPEEDPSWEDDERITIDPRMLAAEAARNRVAIEPAPLLSADIAAALRHMPARDLADLLRRQNHRARLIESGALGGSRTIRKPGQPDAGAYDQIDYSPAGLRIRVGAGSAFRVGALTWPQVTAWLSPGLTMSRRQVLDSAEQALAAYRSPMAIAAAADQTHAAIGELAGIVKTAVDEVIAAALQAHAPATRAQTSDPNPLVLDRVKELQAALSENASRATTQSTQDVDLDAGFEQVIDALSQHVGRPQLASSGSGEEAFADVRAAFAALREALGLSAESLPVMAPAVPVPASSADEGLLRMSDALADAHAYAHWYSSTPEWGRINTVTEAARALVTAIRDAAGDYWAEVRRDIRVRGFMRTVTARTARMVSGAAERLAVGLDRSGRGDTQAFKAAKHLSQTAADCAVRLMSQSVPGGPDRMSEVADIIASLGRSPASQGVGNLAAVRSNAQPGLGAVNSPLNFVRACFPRPLTDRSVIARARWVGHQSRARATKGPRQRSSQRR